MDPMLSLVERFLDSVRRWPNHPAVESLSFLELYERAKSVASQVPPESQTVAILSERSEDAVVGFVACLLGRFRYLPLDPEFPLKRLERMVGLAKPDFYLSSASMEQILPWAEDRVGLLNVSTGQLKSLDQREDHSGYVLFTSGSRKEPRGVVVEGKALDSYAEALTELFHPTVDQVYIHTASFSFSASIRQLLLPLISGGHLLIANSECRSIPEALLTRLQVDEVNIIDTVPSHLRVLARTLERRPVLSSPWLKEVRVTGEPLRWGDVRAWRRVAPDTRLFNLYSQTETGGTVACFAVEQMEKKGQVPLGVPLLDMTVKLVDSTGVEGDIGEIVVVSPRLAQSYLNEQESSVSTAGCYATGDFAERDKDGTLRGQGRQDRRVKVRGHRINLEEVEQALLGDAELIEAVAWVDHELDSLAARLVPRAEPLDLKSLRQRLNRELPPYMVPTRFEVLGEIPKNLHGKADLSLGGKLGDRVLGIWRRVLRLPSLTSTDDFFEVGGNSLVAVELVAGIEDELGYRIAPGAVFEVSTPQAMSERLGNLAQEEGAAGAGSYVVQQGLIGTPKLFFVHLGWEHIPDVRALARAMGPAYPIEALKALGIGELQGPPTVENLALEYIEQLRSLQPEGPYRLVGYSFAGLVAYEMARVLKEQNEEIALLCFLDTHAPQLRPRQRHRNYRWRQNFKLLMSIPNRRKFSFLWEKLQILLPRLRAQRLQKETGNNLELMQTLRDLYIRAGDRYRPKPYEGTILLFDCVANRAPGVLVEAWKTWTQSEFQSISVPGGHHQIFQAGALQTVAEELVKVLQGPKERFLSEEELEQGLGFVGVAGLGKPAYHLTTGPTEVERFLATVKHKSSRWQGEEVPPGFAFAIRYPMLKLWQLPAPTTRLIRHLRVEWISRIRRGQTYIGYPLLTELSERFDPSGKQRIYQTLETEYFDSAGELAARAECQVLEMAKDPRLLSSVVGPGAMIVERFEAPPEPIISQNVEVGLKFGGRIEKLTRQDFHEWVKVIGPEHEPWAVHASYLNTVYLLALMLPTLVDNLGEDAFLKEVKIAVVQPINLGEDLQCICTVLQVDPKDERVEASFEIKGVKDNNELVIQGVAKVVL